LNVLLDQGHQARALAIERIVSLVATGPARRFGMTDKGSLDIGSDADLVLIDPAESITLAEDDLHQRHRMSPYVGRRFRGVVRRTIRRGETIFMDGRITARTPGQFVRPETRSG
jgi:allantoinase